MGNTISYFRQLLEDLFYSSLAYLFAPSIDNSPQSNVQWNNKREKKSRSKTVRTRPNYFVCLPISNVDIHKALSAVQKNLLASCPGLKPALTSVPCLHITLMVFHLADELEIFKAKLALEGVKEALSTANVRVSGAQSLAVSSPLPTAPVFTVRGLGTFGKQVLFARIEQGKEHVLHIGKCVKSIYEKHGIPSTDRRPLNLHATIAKLSKAPELRKKGIKEILPEWYCKDEEVDFGVQGIENLMLCAMEKPKNLETKFYHVEHSVSLI